MCHASLPPFSCSCVACRKGEHPSSPVHVVLSMHLFAVNQIPAGSSCLLAEHPHRGKTHQSSICSARHQTIALSHLFFGLLSMRDSSASPAAPSLAAFLLRCLLKALSPSSSQPPEDQPLCVPHSALAARCGWRCGLALLLPAGRLRLPPLLPLAAAAISLSSSR